MPKRMSARRNLAVALLAVGFVAFVAISQAQGEHKTYLGSVHGPMPTATATTAPTATPGLPSWRRPGSSYRQLTVLDVERLDTATLRITVSNTTDVTIQSLVLTRVRYVDGVPQPNEFFMRRSGMRFVPGEIDRFLFFISLPSDPSYQIEAFGLPL